MSRIWRGGVPYTDFRRRAVGRSCEATVIKSFVNAIVDSQDAGEIHDSVRRALNK
jgi:hypothetical protein